MKPTKSNRILAALLTLTATAHAASFTWDGNGSTAPNPNGGTGTWDVNTSQNWWNGSTNVVWPTLGGTDDDAVFANTAGTVSLATGGITANDLSFSTTGYIIQNNTLTLNGTTANLSADTGVTATINSVIAGSGTVVTKTGAGILVLGGTNTYTGKTAITAGVLSINADNKLGAAPAAAVADQLTLNGGTLRITTGNITIAANRGITVGSSGATIETNTIANTSNLNVTIGGVITGSGPVTIRSHGDTSATGGGSNTIGTRLNQSTNTFTGDVTVTAGLVSYANNLSFGNVANKIILNGGGLVDNNLNIPLSRNIEVLSGGGTFRMWGSVNVAWSGALTGSGNINRTDTGTLTFTGDLSAYTGTYNNLRGVTTLNTSAANIGGNWNIDASSGGLRIDGTGTQTISGLISGAGALNKQGTGNLRLNSVITGNTYTGATSVTGGGTLTLTQSRAASTSAITVTGSKLALNAGSGLHEGSLTASALNITAVNPATAVTNGTPRANSSTGWSSNQQWNYSGSLLSKIGQYVRSSLAVARD